MCRISRRARNCANAWTCPARKRRIKSTRSTDVAVHPQGDADTAARASGLTDPAPGGSAIGRLFGYVSLAVKLVLFALVFALAVKNSEPVTLRFFLGRELVTSLAVALVVALCIGALLGVLAMIGYAFTLRREAARARAEMLALRAELAAAQQVSPASLSGSDAAEAARILAPDVSTTDRQASHGL